MIKENEIRAELVKYLAGEQSLDQFEDWFVQHSWNMHKDSSLSAQRLSSAIELRLAEHSSGHLSEEELRDQLRPYVVRYVVTVSFSSEAETVEVESSGAAQSTPSQLAGRLSVAEFA
ncbi:MAG TPA: hypothetical protein VJ023_05445 [Pyrinomonadaceae bacterium]|nr:hypothetical protein [Pyrinomonadaceae bacterium]